MSGETPLGYLRQINEKMDRLLSIAERYAGVPSAVVAEPVAEPAAAAAAVARTRIPTVVNTAQAYARMLRRTLEKGVADPSSKAKLEKDLRELQPKIDAEIAAGIPLESEFQSQYDAAELYLTRNLKPESRAKMERTRNELKAKLNAEKLHGIARGGSKKRKTTRKRQTRSRRN
jgi:hypothetical protein